MQPSQPKHGIIHHEARLDQDVAENRILVIGEVSRWDSQGRQVPQSPGIHCIDIHDLTTNIIELIEPMAVFSPLLCSSFDCLDVAVILQAVGYKGRYRVIGEGLHYPQLIRAEIKESCPDIDFDIVNLGKEKDQRAN